MEGVAEPGRVHRARGRRQGLTQHLAAEHPLNPMVGAGAPEEILLDFFQVQQGEKPGQGRCVGGFGRHTGFSGYGIDNIIKFLQPASKAQGTPPKPFPAEAD